MDIIHLFVSDVLVDFIVSDNYDFTRRKICMDKNFYDIDTYILWAKKKLDRLARTHIQQLFDGQSISLEEYYKTWEQTRRNPSFLVSLRHSLECIFPFVQRIKNSQPIIFKYLDMLETIYDTIKEDVDEPKSAKADVPEEVATDDEPLQECVVDSKKPAPTVYEECKRLGIKVSINESPAGLLELYKNNSLDSSKLTLKGMKDFIQKVSPTVGLSRRSRDEIVKLFNSMRK